MRPLNKIYAGRTALLVLVLVPGFSNVFEDEDENENER